MNPWDNAPPDSRRTRIIGWVLVIGVTAILYLYLTAEDRRRDNPTPTPTGTVSR